MTISIFTQPETSVYDLCDLIHLYTIPGKTHVVVVVLDGLACEVEHGPGNDALADEVADLEVCGQDGLRVFVLDTDTQSGGSLASCYMFTANGTEDSSRGNSRITGLRGSNSPTLRSLEL